MTSPLSYSRTQVILHWLVVILVLFQIFVHDRINQIWQDRVEGAVPDAPVFELHTVVGALIFFLMLWRLFLRLRRGVPTAVERGAAQAAARAIQWLFYATLLSMPVFGALAWFFGIEVGATLHSYAYWLLLLLIPVHVAIALVHHFYLKDSVLRRMLGRA